MTNKEPVKYQIGQQIVVRSPITRCSLHKGKMYRATIINTPEESGTYQAAFKMQDIPSLSCCLLTGCNHLEHKDWKVIGNLTPYTNLLIKVNNFLISWSR